MASNGTKLSIVDEQAYRHIRLGLEREARAYYGIEVIRAPELLNNFVQPKPTDRIFGLDPFARGSHTSGHSRRLRERERRAKPIKLAQFGIDKFSKV